MRQTLIRIVGMGAPTLQAAQERCASQTRLQTGQRSAKTVVDTIAKGHVLVRCAGDVEPVWVYKRLRIAVCRGPEQSDLATGRDGGAMYLDITRRRTEQELHWRIVAQDFLHHAWDERRVVAEHTLLLRMGRQRQHRVPDQVRRGLVAGHE